MLFVGEKIYRKKIAIEENNQMLRTQLSDTEKRLVNL